MVFKVWSPDTGRWRLIEAKSVETGKMWLGMFGADSEGDGNANWRFALYDRKDFVPARSDGEPVAQRAPLLLKGLNDDFLVDEDTALKVARSEGKTRVCVNVAVLRDKAGEEQVIAYTTPAYALNDTGGTIEKL